MKNPLPPTLRTDDACLQFLFELRCAGNTCAHCKRPAKTFHRHPAKQCYTCNCGRTHFYPKTGTIFERSHVPLTTWFAALMTTYAERGTMSVRQMENELDVSYRTAWSLSKKLRGIVESTERWPASFEAFVRKLVTQ